MPNSGTTFVHLHVHSEYSLLDGSLRISEIISQAKSMGHSHVALTDHGNMHGAIDFYMTAKKNGVIPILGCEIYHQPLTDFDALKKEMSGDITPQPGPYHLVLLAKDTVGYHNLLKVISTAFCGDNLADVPVVPLQEVAKYCKNLVALSACQKGEFGTLIDLLRRISGPGAQELIWDQACPKAGPVVRAIIAYYSKMKELFGPQDFYIELIDNNLPGQRQALVDFSTVADHLSAPLVASADAHYFDRDFADLHALAIAIKNGLTLSDLRDRLRDTNFHLCHQQEMTKLFQQWPQALSNTIEIAQKCSGVEIKTGTYFLPRIDLGAGETPTEALQRIANEGLIARFHALDPIYGESFDDDAKKVYWQRLTYELEVIAQMGFPDYFLIVHDFIAWAKSQEIPVGPGRGSGAGSLVAYALRITDIDPLPYNLIFERFLNPERVSMPDFDIDFCQWRREEVIQYCIKKYGEDRVAQITTFGKMQAKGAVKSVGRAMNLGYSRVDKFTKLFPTDLGITLEQALEAEPRLLEEMAKDDSLEECMQHAQKLEGLVSHTSVHAAGIVISDGPMTDYVPIYTTDGKSYITQYEMKPTEKVGLVKFDFLGLKTLTVIDKAVRLIAKNGKGSLDITSIPLDDDKVYQLISAGHTCGIFQCESSGITQLIVKLKPSTFEDVIALVALFRPGPLGSGMVDDFVERKHGRQKIAYPHPNLEPILRDTYGMILYQEQVQKIAAVLASYSLGEADLLRRAMGKKIAEEMAMQKDRFLSGAATNNIDSKVSEDIFDLMAEFAKYGFNKSHSAAYGLVSYQTAYLKTHFPEQFLAASMTCDMDNTDKIVRYVEDSQRQGFRVLNPCINRSHLEFDVPKDGQIDFALSAIKGVGEMAVKPMLMERDSNGHFTSLTNLATRVNLNKLGKKTLQLLIQAGALDEFGYTRNFLEQTIPTLVAFSSQLHDQAAIGQRSLFAMPDSAISSAPERREFHPWEHSHLSNYPPEQRWQATNLLQEKKVLGVYLSAHPLELYRVDRRHFSPMTLKLLLEQKASEPTDGQFRKKKSEKGNTQIVVFYSGIQYRRTKTGKLMAYVRLEEPGFSCEALMFEDALERTTLPKNETPILAIGSVDRFGDGPPKFTIDELLSLEQVRDERVKDLWLKCDLPSSTDETTKISNELQDLIKNAEEGGVRLNFVLKSDKGKVRIRGNDHQRIYLSNDLIDRIQQLSCKNFDFAYQLQT